MNTATEKIKKYKPYPEYKDSGVEWLGDIPKEWKVTKIKRLACQGYRTFTDGDWIESPYITNEGVRLIQTGNIGVGTYREQGYRYVSNETFNSLHCTEIKPGNILICRLAEPVGRACIAPDLGGRMITSVDVCILKPNEKCDPRFIVYSLSNPQYLSWLEAICRGGTRLRVSRSMLGAIEFLAPSRPVQQVIADFLDRRTVEIDELIAKKERVIELLKEKRTAIISHAVTKGLNPDAKMKDSGIDWLEKIPEHWKVKRLRHIIEGTLVNGLFKKKEHFGSGVNLINVFDIYRDNFLVDTDSLERVEANKTEIEKYAVKSGDIFFVRSSLKLEGVGKSVCMLDVAEPTVFECHVVRARPDTDQILPVFLINYLNSTITMDRLISLANMVTMTTLDQIKIKDIEVTVPPILEQVAIAKYLKQEYLKTDTLVSKVTEAIEKLKESRKAFISAAVTGKIDVRREDN